MDARPVLAEVARHLNAAGIEAVLIGNAAAALQGAPVTTVDVDFLFRKTPRNLAKLREFARRLEAMILRPYYPMSGLYRVVRDRDTLQVDFMTTMHGVRSFEGVRSRATVIEFDGATLMVGSLEDLVRSKRAAARPQDLAVLPTLEKVLEAQRQTRSASNTTTRRPRTRK